MYKLGRPQGNLNMYLLVYFNAHIPATREEITRTLRFLSALSLCIPRALNSACPILIVKLLGAWLFKEHIVGS